MLSYQGTPAPFDSVRLALRGIPGSWIGCNWAYKSDEVHNFEQADQLAFFCQHLRRLGLGSRCVQRDSQSLAYKIQPLFPATRCGILEHGFVRLYCKDCHAEKVVGFSCKGRGFCPPCGARRAIQKADRIEREVWPQAKARQWVLTFPHQVRFWLLRNPKLFNEVISIVVDSIAVFYEQHSAAVFGQDQIYLPTAGSISFVQFFGSSLAPNPHLHMMFLDGVFARGKDGIKFYEHQGFCQESMFDVMEMIYLRLVDLFTERGYVMTNGEVSSPEDEEDLSVTQPFIPRAPKAYRRKGRLLANPLYQHPDPDVKSIESWLNVRYKWFSLHAAVSIEGTNRSGLRQLFHYGARSSVNLSLLSYVDPDDPDRSDVELRLKRKWKDGTESLVLSQRPKKFNSR